MLHTTIPLRRVLVIGNDLLFEEALTKLLTTGTNLSVSGAKYTGDPTFLEDIAQQQPDVILLNEEIIGFDPDHILDLIFSAPMLTVLYVVVVRLASNMVDVYEKEISKKFLVTERDELVAVVQGNFQKM